MNYRMVGRYLGYLLLAEAVFLLPAVLVALLYDERPGLWALLATCGICAVLGLVLRLLGGGTPTNIYPRDGFVVAGVGWILLSLLGALPFFFSGEIPNYFNAFFEAASGFTTTGASILKDVEAMSHGLLFWRSFTHWMGGIGVLAFVLAMVRARGGAGFAVHLMRAETPGPQKGKLLPKTQASMRSLLAVYLGLSLVNLVFLLAGGMPLFEALCTMFGTAGTGGFGIKNDSMASYSPYLQTVTGVFMALFGVNFALYYLLLRRQWRSALKDEELRLYVGIILGTTVLITVSLFASGQLPLGQGLHHAFFTVSSIITTTGFATLDFDLWPQFARSLLLVLMLCGAMAGSTGGGFKISRILILFKSLRAGISRLLHPRSVRTVKVNGHAVEQDVSGRLYLFLAVYVLLIVFVTLFISLDGLSLETNLSATISCINNIGPGLGAVGPTQNYSVYSNFSTLLLALTMLLGRLEIFPILLLVSPAIWSKKN